MNILHFARKKNHVISIVLFLVLPLISGSALAQDHGTGIVIGKYEKFYSKILKEKRTIKIRLPENYKKSKHTHHVLYLLDAEWNPQYNQAVGAVGYAAEFKLAPEMIVVGICNTVRNRDMIPAVVTDRPGSGGGKKFLQFISKELIPYINQKYAPNSRNVLYGGSNAGLFTVFAILEESGSFIGGIAGSPMIGHCRDYMYRIASQLKDKPKVKSKYLYMIYGENDYSRCTDYIINFHNHILKVKPDLFHTKLVMQEGEGHVPYISLYKGLMYLFSNNK